MSLKRIAPVVALFIITTMPVAATTTVITTNAADWLSKIQVTTTLNFEGIAAPGGTAYYSADPFTIGGVTFQATPGTGTLAGIVDPGYEPVFYDWGSGAVLNFDYGNPNSLTATLPAGTYGLAFDMMTFGPYAANFLITVVHSGGSSVSAAFPTNDYPVRAFIGAYSDEAIASIEVSTSTLGANIDNFQFGTQAGAAVPEPASLLLLGTGLAGIGLAVWRRRM